MALHVIGYSPELVKKRRIAGRGEEREAEKQRRRAWMINHKGGWYSRVDWGDAGRLNRTGGMHEGWRGGRGGYWWWVENSMHWRFVTRCPLTAGESLRVCVFFTRESRHACVTCPRVCVLHISVVRLKTRNLCLSRVVFCFAGTVGKKEKSLVLCWWRCISHSMKRDFKGVVCHLCYLLSVIWSMTLSFLCVRLSGRKKESVSLA